MTKEKSVFVIEAEEVNRLHQESGLDLEEFIATLVEPTRSLARAPISNFYVGAVGMGASGRIFRGVNVEFVGLPLNHSIHAEQFLVANAAQHGEKRLTFLAVSAAPCGHCRQFLQELRGAGDLRVLIADSMAETHTLAHFLPHRFGPQDLLEDDFPLLLEAQENDLVFNTSKFGDGNTVTGGSTVEHNGTRSTGKTANGQELNAPPSQQLTHLRDAALKAANSSYAPYTKCPSGIAFTTSKGTIHCGSYLESAAYNPGLPALQASVVAFLSHGGKDLDEIQHAVLVEKEGSLVEHADTVKLVLQKISPKSTFHVFEAQKNVETPQIQN